MNAQKTADPDSKPSHGRSSRQQILMGNVTERNTELSTATSIIAYLARSSNHFNQEGDDSEGTESSKDLVFSLLQALTDKSELGAVEDVGSSSSRPPRQQQPKKRPPVLRALRDMTKPPSPSASDICKHQMSCYDYFTSVRHPAKESHFISSVLLL